MKASKIIAYGVVVTALACVGMRPAVAAGYPLAGWATRVNTGANAGSVTLGLVFGGPGTMVIFR